MLRHLTIVTSSHSVKDIGSKGFPVEMTEHGGERLPVTEMAKRFVYMIDQDVPNSFGTAVAERNSDVRYAKSGAGGAVLVQEAGGWV